MFETVQVASTPPLPTGMMLPGKRLATLEDASKTVLVVPSVAIFKSESVAEMLVGG
jgi:hypothetical protein